MMGVNHDKYDPAKHHVISNASCTTNCLVPVVKVVIDKFGFVNGFMTTVHSYTNDQQILDLPHKDLRRARAAAAVDHSDHDRRRQGHQSLVIPEVKGKIDGVSLRVPTADVSLVDLTCTVKKSTSIEEVNAAFQEAAKAVAQGNPRGERRAARFGRLHRQPELEHGRPRPHQRAGRHAGPCLVLVRQRDGLLGAVRGSDSVHRAAVISGLQAKRGLRGTPRRPVPDETLLRDLQPAALDGRRALVRVDFNCPIKDGVVTDNTRIRAVAAHHYRTCGRRAPGWCCYPIWDDRRADLIPSILPDTLCAGAGATARRSGELHRGSRRTGRGDRHQAASRGGVAIVENTRFYPGEEKNDPELAKTFAGLGDFYVNDAFGSAHRAHSSTEAVATLLKPAVAGFLMERELKYLGEALHQPKRPFVAVLGGAKVSARST